MIVAIPSEAPGGLEAAISPHFGHCAAFTLVELNQKQIGAVKIVPNQGHEQGGCMAPVMMLKQLGADALVAGGMGMRPLAGFQQVGIQVFYNEDVATVSEAVTLLAEGKARVFGPAQVCGGGPGGGEGGGCGGH
jgi:predicted Fe-Mo cluster-binding NifX family protein